MRITLMPRLSLIAILFLFSCSEKAPEMENELAQEERDYWFDGTAEISKFDLKQARYGEFHEGSITHIFVTEPFSKTKYVKADEQGEDDVTVLKHIMIRRFQTGMYDYSMMLTTFLPFDSPDYSLKLTSSSQDWCGQSFLEMINESGQFLIDYESYFEDKSAEKAVGTTYLEDDIWGWIRLHPNNLPTGEFQMIPSIFFLQLTHNEIKDYSATASVESQTDSTSTYSINYSELQREISIEYLNIFPYSIIDWSETYPSKDKLLTSEVTKQSEFKSDYWNNNSSTFNQ